MKVGPSPAPLPRPLSPPSCPGHRQHLPALLCWVVVDHVDDAAGGVEGSAGRQGDGQVAGMSPEPRAGQRGHLHLLGQL